MLTLAEYIDDYATPKVKEKGARVIKKNLDEMEEGKVKQELLERLEKVESGERDLYF